MKRYAVDGDIMLSRREHRAVVLAIASSVGNQPLVEQIRRVAGEAGLTDLDIEAITSGGIPRESGLANIVAATYLVLDKRGALDDQDRFDVRNAGIGPVKLAEIVQLSQVNAEMFPERRGALGG